MEKRVIFGIIAFASLALLAYFVIRPRNADLVEVFAFDAIISEHDIFIIYFDEEPIVKSFLWDIPIFGFRGEPVEMRDLDAGTHVEVVYLAENLDAHAPIFSHPDWLQIVEPRAEMCHIWDWERPIAYLAYVSRGREMRLYHAFGHMASLRTALLPYAWQDFPIQDIYGNLIGADEIPHGAFAEIIYTGRGILPDPPYLLGVISLQMREIPWQSEWRQQLLVAK
ncbi:MAG: hypothetical protein LBE35_10520 [Clostridiales bacterium]|jgi:hypothetical protein|nr:hypothetical protein [Clostridiales bacterium]